MKILGFNSTKFLQHKIKLSIKKIFKAVKSAYLKFRKRTVLISSAYKQILDSKKNP
jgi:hypothetical protein